MDLNKYNFNKNDSIIMDAIWAKIKTNGSILYPIDDILFPTFTKSGLQLLSIYKIPHYNFVKSIIMNLNNEEDFNTYKNYLVSYFPNNVESDLSRIYSTIDYCKKCKYNEIEVCIRKPINSIIMFDGTHRTAIAKVLGHTKVKCYIYECTI